MWLTRFVGAALTFRGLWLLDALLCIGILSFTRYTEIDWNAYMDEVAGYLGGERDYTKLRGDTGPLVYPAGFVYLYSGLYYITKQGDDIAVAQLLFACMYLMLTAIVFRLYGTCRVPFLYVVPLVLSRRIHSIFLLRMFNDGIAMLLAYLAVLHTALREWKQGAFWFSVAVSVKMNILLFAPGFLCVWLRNLPWWHTAMCLAICASVQLFTGAPFLTTYPVEYLTKAFELSRVFTYKWTVNFKCVPEWLFASPILGVGLLAATACSWGALWWLRWRKRSPSSAEGIVLTLFESNLVGVIFARTLHYQFYIWFFHQVPLVLALSCTKLNRWVSLAIVVAIDYAFTAYPSTAVSSGLLLVAFFGLWVGMMRSRDVSIIATNG